MGLDQYITIRHKSTNVAYEKWNNYWKLSDEERKNVREPNEPEKDLILGYFRKHHSIHQWFVKNIQNGNDDCGRYKVSVNELETLKKLCEEIMSHVAKEKAEPKFYTTNDGRQYEMFQYDKYTIDEEGKKIIDELLPSHYQSWGNEGYSDDYFYTLENAIEVLGQVIEICNRNFFSFYTDRETGEYKGCWVLEYVSSW